MEVKNICRNQNANMAFRDRDVLRVCSRLTEVPETLLVYASRRFTSMTIEEVVSLFITSKFSISVGSNVLIGSDYYFSLWKYCTNFFHNKNADFIIRSLLFETKITDIEGTAPLQRIYHSEREHVIYEDEYGKHYDGFLNQYFDKLMKSSTAVKSQASYGKAEIVGYSVKKSIAGSHNEPSKGRKYTDKTKGDFGYLYKDIIFDSLDDLCAELNISIRVLTSYSYLWKKVYNMYDVSSAVRLCLSDNGTRTYQSVLLDDLVNDFGLNSRLCRTVENGYLRAERLG